MQRPNIIRANAAGLPVHPNWYDYAGQRASFTWAQAHQALGLDPGGTLNIGDLCTDRHLRQGRGQQAALDFVASGRRLSYGQLAASSTQYGQALRCLGLEPGDAVFTLLGRVPELFITVLGALKAGMVACPLFSAFGPEPVRTRLDLGAAKVLVTSAGLYQRKVLPVLDQLPALRAVIVTDDVALEGTRTWSSFMQDASSCGAETAVTRADDAALLHFTSGTTGKPKGAVHVHGAALMHWMTGYYALDLHPGDVYWCTADPGWVTGTSYGIIAPLLHGAHCIIDDAEFDAYRWYSILQEHAVQVWYTAPTAIRMLMKAGAAAARGLRPDRLRLIASVGEPLNPEAVWWGVETFGQPILDNWWQTETGGIMIANAPAFDVKPGSMGRPLPGVEAQVVVRDAAGQLQIAAADEQGELALRRGWPSMFRAYLNNPERYQASFCGDFYLTGDLARRDQDGYFWFIGRADDVIKSAGHLIGPFEVESALMEHAAVAEAGVIGKPDPIAGEVVKAFVTLRSGQAPTAALHAELLAHARQRLGAAVAPKELEFAACLPRTRSGKIMRRLLKARELGLPEGDTSTLELPS
ncbi:MAG TPA: acetate--CoA ligase [Pseudoduganella sp.]